MLQLSDKDLDATLGVGNNLIKEDYIKPMTSSCYINNNANISDCSVNASTISPSVTV